MSRRTTRVAASSVAAVMAVSTFAAPAQGTAAASGRDGRSSEETRDVGRDGGPGESSGRSLSIEDFMKEVETDDVFDHLEEFQEIADENDGTRASGWPGYDESVEYVVEELEDAGYEPTVQEFVFPYEEDLSEFERVSPDPVTYEPDVDFIRNFFEDPFLGEASGRVVPVDLDLDAPDQPENTTTSGCEEADFAGFAEGAVALVQRGTCTFDVKTANAEAAGAVAVIVMNEGQPGREGLFGMSGTTTEVPVIAVPFAVGAELAAMASGTEPVVRVEVDVFTEERKTYNVLAETKHGDHDNVVMAGAHLDSVLEGAGINDNGTGSAALLEVALELADERVKADNAVRFAWWGAEESGLLGAEHYVANLSEDDLDRIALYLNFDMVGSPNYVFGVYDGDNSGETAPEGFIPPGSAQIEAVFQRYYEKLGEPYVDSEFSGRSDYGPFIAVSIPAGGLFTGAEVVKTEEEQELFGGVAGVAFDPCYHQICDNLDGEHRTPEQQDTYDHLEAEYKLHGNVNVHAVDVNTDVMAATILTLARDASAVTDPTP